MKDDLKLRHLEPRQPLHPQDLERGPRHVVDGARLVDEVVVGLGLRIEDLGTLPEVV